MSGDDLVGIVTARATSATRRIALVVDSTLKPSRYVDLDLDLEGGGNAAQSVHPLADQHADPSSEKARTVPHKFRLAGDYVIGGAGAGLRAIESTVWLMRMTLR